MSTEEKKLIDVVFGRNAIRQTTVVNPDASIEGRRYLPEHLKDGAFGVAFTVDLRAMRGKKMTPEQRISLHRVLLRMAVNIFEHDVPVLTAGELRTPASEPRAQERPVSWQQEAAIEQLHADGLIPYFDRVPEEERDAVEYLYDTSTIADEQLKDAIVHVEAHGGSVLEALSILGYIDEKEQARAVAHQQNVTFVDLENIEIDPTVIQSVPKNVVFEYSFIPVERKKGTLVIAVADPLDFFALDNLHFILNVHVEQVLATKSALGAAIEKYYSEQQKAQGEDLGDLGNGAVIEDVDSLLAAVDPVQTNSGNDRERAAASTAVVKLVNLFLLQGIKAMTSKVIVTAEEDDCKIRMEIEGVLYDMQSPPAHLGQAFIDRLKRMAGVSLEEGSRGRSSPIARIELQIGGRPVNVDVNFVPLARGELAILNISFPSSPKKDGGEEGDGPAPVGAKT